MSPLMSERMNIIDFWSHMLQTVKFFEFKGKSKMWTERVGEVFLEQLGELSWLLKTEKDKQN